MTTALVVGATGKTGRLLVEHLLGRDHKVRIIARSPDKLSAGVLGHPNLTVIKASVLDLTDQEMTKAAKNCDAIVSCLGHVMNFKGMFGEPRKLCTDATRRLCNAIEANSPPKPTKFILMSSVGVADPNNDGKRTGFDRRLLSLLRYIVPPHRDNETAAEHLHRIGTNKSKHLEWCAVRPDSLIDTAVSPYEINASPSTGIMTGRPTARSNVADFMAELIDNAELWDAWKFRMPVIMNAANAGDNATAPA
ncbi:MAG: SDR family oxidoreductase [Pseudolabrys sp.]|nr:SDR family oxidoreductase [Pseudolabrys sp.]